MPIAPDPPTVIYEAQAKRNTRFFGIWRVMLRNLYESRHLMLQVIKRDLVAPYKRSFIGVSWMFLSPLMGILSWLFLNAMGMLNTGDVGVPYPVYVLLGTTIWGLFMGCYEASAETLGSGSGWVLQARFPHEVLFVKQIVQYLANFLAGFAVNIVVLLIFQVVPHWKIIFLPFAVLPVMALGASIGLVVSLFNVVVLDIKKITTYLLGLMIFLTPVIYASNFSNPVLQSIIQWNPLNYLVAGPRDLMLHGHIGSGWGFAVSTGLSLVMFLLAWRLFYVAEEKIIERMG